MGHAPRTRSHESDFSFQIIRHIATPSFNWIGLWDDIVWTCTCTPTIDCLACAVTCRPTMPRLAPSIPTELPATVIDGFCTMRLRGTSVFSISMRLYNMTPVCVFFEGLRDIVRFKYDLSGCHWGRMAEKLHFLSATSAHRESSIHLSKLRPAPDVTVMQRTKIGLPGCRNGMEGNQTSSSQSTWSFCIPMILSCRPRLRARPVPYIPAPSLSTGSTNRSEWIDQSSMCLGLVDPHCSCSATVGGSFCEAFKSCSQPNSGLNS